MNPQNHSFIGESHFKRIIENGKDILKIFLAYCVDMDRYKAWIKGNLQENIAQTATILEKKLQECQHGSEGWKQYEDLCIEIVEYLFRNTFRNYKESIQLKYLMDYKE